MIAVKMVKREHIFIAAMLKHMQMPSKTQLTNCRDHSTPAWYSELS